MRDITQCHPRLQSLASTLIKSCSAQGLTIKIGECLRTVAEQDALYAQGRTTSGSIVTNAKGSSYNSMHQWGVAFDIIRNDGKGAYNNNDGFFDKVGKIGVALGLEWGGNWTSPVDKPHFQLADWGSTPTKLKQMYKNPEVFFKTWENIIKEGNTVSQTTTDKTTTDKTTTNKITTYDEAMKILVSKGVVTSREYWDNAVKCVKYLDTLIINMANSL